jgi:hypothetical protein
VPPIALGPTAPPLRNDVGEHSSEQNDPCLVDPNQQYGTPPRPSWNPGLAFRCSPRLRAEPRNGSSVLSIGHQPVNGNALAGGILRSFVARREVNPPSRDKRGSIEDARGEWSGGLDDEKRDYLRRRLGQLNGDAQEPQPSPFAGHQTFMVQCVGCSRAP